jgi:hypothetical protein
MKQLEKEYKVGDRVFLFDINSLRSSFKEYKSFSDEEFIENIEDILHYAVFVCWIKEIPGDECLADDGIVHELVHCLKKNTRNHTNLKLIRKKFNKYLVI